MYCSVAVHSEVGVTMITVFSTQILPGAKRCSDVAGICVMTAYAIAASVSDCTAVAGMNYRKRLPSVQAPDLPTDMGQRRRSVELCVRALSKMWRIAIDQ